MKKLSNKTTVITRSIVWIFLVSLLLSCNSGVFKWHRIEYVISSSPAGFTVTYGNGRGGNTVVDVNDNFWLLSFDGKDQRFINVSTTSRNANAEVIVTIIDNGRVIKRASGNGVAAVNTIID